MAPASVPDADAQLTAAKGMGSAARWAMIEHALDCDEHDFTQCPNFRAGQLRCDVARSRR